MDCDDAFWEQFPQTGFAHTGIHFLVSRKLHNNSSLTIFVTVELFLENGRVPGIGDGRSLGGDVRLDKYATSLAPINSPNGDHGLWAFILG